MHGDFTLWQGNKVARIAIEPPNVLTIDRQLAAARNRRDGPVDFFEGDIFTHKKPKTAICCG